MTKFVSQTVIITGGTRHGSAQSFIKSYAIQVSDNTVVSDIHISYDISTESSLNAF